MGYMRHHAIVVTSWNKELIQKAHNKARRLFPATSEITAPAINGNQSFFIPPDGSKEGWDDSNEADKIRDLFVEWLDKNRYEDGSTSFSWVEVQYGDDNRETIVTRHSDEERYYAGKR